MYDGQLKENDFRDACSDDYHYFNNPYVIFFSSELSKRIISQTSSQRSR